jgi:hypothetical protein
VASTITLPTKPERGEVDWTRKKTLLYGPPKVGKSTLIAELDPENTQKSPDVGIKSLRKWLLGYVDYILHAEIGRGGGRLIRAQPTANILAGGRVPKGGEQLPDTFQMDAGTLRRMLERVA